MTEWRAWLPGGILALGCVFTLGVDRQQRMALRLPLDSIPLSFDGTAGTPAVISPEEQEAAGMTSYIYRTFDRNEAPFTVYAGYYDHQTGGKTIHSPKNCLPGSGWEALNQSETTVATSLGPQIVNQYLLQNHAQKALVFYWYQGRGRVAANEYHVKWDLLRDAALHGRTEETLVRIVVFLDAHTDASRATTVATNVAANLIPEVMRILPD